MKWLFFILFIFKVQAGLDMNMKTQLRSYPLAGTLDVEFGYGILIWGEESSKPWYGYIRPRVQGTAIGRFSAYKYQLDFFPISFLGVRAGREETDLSMEPEDYDCVTYKCAMKTTRDFSGANFTFGIGRFFLNLDYLKEDFQPEVADTDFVVPVYGLAFNLAGEEVETYKAVTGLKLSDLYTVFFYGQYTKTVDTNKRMRMSAINLLRTGSSFNMFFGGGVFDSDLFSRKLTITAGLRWKISPSLALF
jgi:hypothetical protein